MINETNFFEGTKGRFIECEKPNLEINYTSYSMTKEISSQYIYTKEGVYRISNHWGGIASCQWNLNTVNEFGMDKCRKTEVKTGYISFKELNDNFKNEKELLEAYGNESLFAEIKNKINGTY